MQVREAEIANVPFLGALAGCSARRSERRVASHTSEEQRRNAPGSAAKNGILAVSASLSLQANRIEREQLRCGGQAIGAVTAPCLYAELVAGPRLVCAISYVIRSDWKCWMQVGRPAPRGELRLKAQPVMLAKALAACSDINKGSHGIEL